MFSTSAAFGGRGGIRTHGTLAGTPVFKTGALNHSATLPAGSDQAIGGWVAGEETIGGDGGIRTLDTPYSV